MVKLSPRCRLLPGTTAVAATALLLAACSSPGSSAIGASGASQSSGTASASGTSSANCVADATAVATAASKPLAVPAVSPVDMKRNAGKSVWMISSVQDTYTQTVGQAFQNAAQAAGMRGRYVVANGQVSQMEQLVQEAVSSRASGIVLLNIPPAAVSGPLSAARAAGITVIDVNNDIASLPLQPGIYEHVSNDLLTMGKQRAAWMLMQTGCKLHVAFMTTPDQPILAKQVNASIAEINSLCPSCQVITSDVNLTTFATDLGPQALTLVRRYPSLDFIDAGVDAFASAISPALQQVGMTNVKLIGEGGDPSTLTAMAAKSTLQVMTQATAPEDYIGWLLLDQLARGMLGLPGKDVALPTRIIDSTNLGNGSVSAVSPGFGDFESTFTKAWGL